MAHEPLAEHLNHPHRRGGPVPGGREGAAGGAPCGDLVRISIAVQDARVREVSFEASGCGSAVAAGSAAATLVDGVPVVEAARVGPHEVAAELGGLSPGKFHAAELAAEALARALGAAAYAAGASEPVPGRCLVAMSGGVDSAVAALLSAGEAGASPVAVTLELWRDAEGDPEASCCSASAVQRARRVARDLGIPHLTLDLREEFGREVVEPWLAGERAGVTPNPCVRCNGVLRLDAMLALADRIGAERLVTGHYARTAPGGHLLRGADPAKDQSFMLAALSAASLERLSFPLGGLEKGEVRRMAATAGLEVAAAPDSQDLCFLAGVGRERFMERFGGFAAREGKIIDRDGRVLGTHCGAHRFTVGQRRGLALGGLEEPVYVIATDLRANTVTVGPRRELDRERIALRDLRLHGDRSAVRQVRLRSHAPPVECRLEGTQLRLSRPVRAPAPGQTAVFLDGERVLGCATIA